MILLGIYSTLFYSYCLTHFYYLYRYNINLFQILRDYNTKNHFLELQKDPLILLNFDEFVNIVNNEIYFTKKNKEIPYMSEKDLLINKNSVLLELVETVQKRNIEKEDKDYNVITTSDNEYELIGE